MAAEVRRAGSNPRPIDAVWRLSTARVSSLYFPVPQGLPVVVGFRQHSAESRRVLFMTDEYRMTKLRRHNHIIWAARIVDDVETTFPSRPTLPYRALA